MVVAMLDAAVAGGESDERVSRRPARSYLPGATSVAAGMLPRRGGSGLQPCMASITAKPTTYATVTCQPLRSQPNTFFASGYWFVSATPAEDPNQIIDPPKPTAYAM